MDLNTCLMRLGLTNNEAILYCTLAAHGEMTGYECAKLTGISRSNVYIALAGLCEKGGAFAVDGAAQKYSPAPVREFCANKRRELNAIVDYLVENMPSPSAPSDAYITVTGETAIYDKMQNMIAACAERVYLSAEACILEKLTDVLTDVIKRGLKVVVMTEGEYRLDGAIMYEMKRNKGQVRLIVDSRFVLTGDIIESKPCSCLFSASNTLVTLFKDAMKNEIRLIELGELR